MVLDIVLIVAVVLLSISNVLAWYSIKIIVAKIQDLEKGIQNVFTNIRDLILKEK